MRLPKARPSKRYSRSVETTTRLLHVTAPLSCWHVLAVRPSNSKTGRGDGTLFELPDRTLGRRAGFAEETLAHRRAATRWLPSRLLTNPVLVARALEYISRRRCIDYAEVDVELRAKRDGRQVPEKVCATGSRFVCGDCVGDESLTEREPARSSAVVVDVRIHRSLEEVAVVRTKVPHPHVEVDDLLCVLWLTELDQPEARVGCAIDGSQNHLQVEVGRRGTPGGRARVGLSGDGGHRGQGGQRQQRGEELEHCDSLKTGLKGLRIVDAKHRTAACVIATCE